MSFASMTRRFGLPAIGRAGVRLLVLTALVVVTLAAISTTLAFTSYQREGEIAVTELGLRARAAAADVDRFVLEQLDTLRAVAAAPPIMDRDLPAAKAYLERVRQAVSGFDGGIGFVDQAGQVLALSGYDGPPVDASGRDYVRVVLATGGPYVSDAVISLVQGVPMVFFAVPATTAAGELHGLVVGGIRLDTIAEGGGSLRYAGASEVYIVDRAGQLIVAGQPVTSLDVVTERPWYSETRSRGHDVLVDVPGVVGVDRRVVAYDAAPAADWLVVVQASFAEAFGGARAALATQLAIIGLVTLASLAALVVAARRIGRASLQLEGAYEREHEARARAEATAKQAEGLLARLEERERLREAFMGMLSHELRTPVTTIYGAAKLLARSHERGDVHGLVEDIEEESDRLYRMIEDLLVLSRAERGQLELSLEPVLLQRLVPVVTQDVKRRFPAVRVLVNCPPDVPPVLADPGPVRQVVNNLLTNAAKYGAGSPISVSVGRRDGTVTLVVEDGGPGFPAEEADRLFDLFYRSQATARMTAGTGVGLYVVQRLVQAMGGTVRAESREERGARFVITLPVVEPVGEAGEGAPGPAPEQWEPEPAERPAAGADSRVGVPRFETQAGPPG